MADVPEPTNEQQWALASLPSARLYEELSRREQLAEAARPFFSLLESVELRNGGREIWFAVKPGIPLTRGVLDTGFRIFEHMKIGVSGMGFEEDGKYLRCEVSPSTTATLMAPDPILQPWGGMKDTQERLTFIGPVIEQMAHPFFGDVDLRKSFSDIRAASAAASDDKARSDVAGDLGNLGFYVVMARQQAVSERMLPDYLPGCVARLAECIENAQQPARQRTR